MTTLQLLGVGAFLMAWYYFVLRTYNTLGLRMFSLFFFVGSAVCYWCYDNYRDLKAIQQYGIARQAIVLKKTDNRIDFRFADPLGKLIVRTQTGGISATEFAAVSEGQPASILYNPQSNVVFLTSSYQRLIDDTVYFLVFPVLLLLIGIVCWISLRKYRVYAHKGTIYEYVTDETGEVVLDDLRNRTTQALRKYSTLSKLIQLFER